MTLLRTPVDVTSTNSHSLQRRFMGSALWIFAGTAGSSLITLITTMILARLIGRQTYGQFVLLQSSINMMGVFAGFGLGAAVTKYVAELRAKDSERLSSILTLSNRTVFVFAVVIASILIIFARPAAAALLNQPDLAVPVALASVAVLFVTLDGFQKSILIGLESSRAYATPALLGSLVGLPVMVYAGYFWGLAGVVVGLGVTAIVQFSISRLQVRRQLKLFNIPHQGSGWVEEWRVVRDFAFPALLAGLLVPLSHWMCQRVLVNSQDGYGEVALFGVAMQWFNAIMFLPTVAGRVVLPMLTGSVTSDNATDSKKLLLLAMRANAVITFPMAFVIALSSPWILPLYGPGFARGWPVLVVAAFTAALLGVQAPVGNMVAATSRMWLGMVMNFGWALIYVGGSLWTARFGAMGIALALCGAYIAHGIWTFAFAIRQVHSLTVAQPESAT